MKKLALTAALVAFAGAASAGNIAPMAADAAPMVEEPMVEMVKEPAGSGALAWILPIVAIAAIALAVDD